MGQEPRITAARLREAAAYLEETSAGALASYSDISFPVVSGDLRRFPRPSPQDRAAERGFEVLRKETNERVATLYALAAALDSGLDVPPALLAPLQPYLDSFEGRRVSTVAPDDTSSGDPEDTDPTAAAE